MRKWLVAACCLLLSSIAAQSQTNPNWPDRYIPPNTEWNAVIAGKQDVITFGSGVLTALANAANASGGICTVGGGGCGGGGGGGITQLNGDVAAGPGTGSQTATITAGAVSLGKMASLAANAIIGNNTGAPATPVALTAAQVKTLLSIQTTDITGPTGGGQQCLQVNNAGAISGTAAPCGGSGSVGGNPTATAGPNAINGSASTFMRSDAAPAVQLGTNAQQGLVEGDGATLSCSAGVCGTTGAVVAGVTGTVTAAQWAAGDIFVVKLAGQTLTLPLSSTLSNNGTIAIQTIGQSVTLAPNAADAINGGSAGSSITIAAGLTAYVTQGTGANSINVSPTTAGSSGVSSFSAGTTGLTPNSPTTGAITLAGTLAPSNGGTGINALGTGVAAALGNATNAANGICVLGANACDYRTASIGWIAGVNPNNAGLIVFPANSTLVSIVGNVETAVGSAATVSVNVAASGTACSAGTTVHSGSFNANGTAATNQTLTLTTTAITAAQRLCLQTTGTTDWTSGSGVGTLTVTYTTP